jgi:hypothetical protein
MAHLNDELRHKTMDVILSCKTNEQFENAVSYVKLAMKKSDSIRDVVVLERALAVTQYRIAEGIA